MRTIYTDHAKRRLVERDIPDFDMEQCRVAKHHVLRELQYLCKAHAEVTTRESKFVYWHRGDGDDRIVYVTEAKDKELVVITAMRYKKIPSDKLAYLLNKN